MIAEQIDITPAANWSQKLKDYSELVKLRLNLLVVFSSAISYAMAAAGNINWLQLGMLSLGGFLVVGASNGINQIIEKDFDKLMIRTANRPIATQRMSVMEAAIASALMGIAGVLILGLFLNQMSAILAFAALLSYAFLYTPLKRISPISVFVGAFPGAIPPMLGWVAVTGTIGVEAVILFLIQFFWQFPHFWSIAWVLDDDYKRAGFKMLPSKEGRDKKSALQNLSFTLVLIPLSFIPLMYNMTGTISAYILLASGLVLLYQSYRLFKTCSIADAKKLMFASFLYLPVVQLSLFFDKI
ncbi:MAG: heme o synthase [Bacteroidia bacterium]|nr:heme o synthase [Bacteroidia bacterium]